MSWASKRLNCFVRAWSGIVSGPHRRSKFIICHMSIEQNRPPLRLRRKHGSGRSLGVTPVDGGRLIEVQSIRNSIIAGLIVIIAFSLCWISVSSLTNRVFPWATVVLGFLLGHAVRLAGRGIDWQFSALAAALAIVGSLIANITIAASVTAEEFGVRTIQVLRSVTIMTWPVFFDEVMTVADVFFAIVGAAIAAFYAGRRLTRAQSHAVRLWKEEQQRD